ncbi:MRG/MORF4L-binding protein [Sitophilus oryzae]|uniref:MRG/MORF4L-binding protein n=1 Tax=Sitophilus oryzae TaxID=7048 RepID=A0A6J2XGR5_SITOR|nr:MRG/MORF4L-binding protein [Sitophilus oryzae]
MATTLFLMLGGGSSNINKLLMSTEDIEWNVINEGQLLDAMVGHKPVGVNKYFQMALICDKFSESLNKDIDPQKIWAHLETMYNLEALDENESIPFPNNEREFCLPESEFGMLLIKKEEDDEKTSMEMPKLARDTKKDEKTLTKNTKDTTLRRDSKEGKDNNKMLSNNKKDIKKEAEKSGKPSSKNRNSTNVKDDNKGRDTPKPTKRTRGSLKPNDDSGSSGKSSPITVTPSSAKRRRL